MSTTTYDELLFDLPSAEADTPMSPTPKKTFGQQLFEWSRSVGVLLVSGAIFFVGLGNKLANIEYSLAQNQAWQQKQSDADNRRNELFNIILQAQIDMLHLISEQAKTGAAKKKAEEIRVKLEQQKKVSQKADHWRDAVGCGYPASGAILP